MATHCTDPSLIYLPSGGLPGKINKTDESWLSGLFICFKKENFIIISTFDWLLKIFSIKKF